MGHTATVAPAINPFAARWTARGNNLCLGHWEISYCGQPLQLAPGRRQNDMGTYGIYSYIYPDDDVFAEGQAEDAWIINHADWLTTLLAQHGIPADEEHLRAFYRAVNVQDWRCGSCGGCI